MAQSSLDALEVELLESYRSRTPRSAALYQRALSRLPGGDTRASSFFMPYPVFFSKGRGFELWDEDGNRYLDFLNNFTSLIHGHAHPGTTTAIQQQAELGTAYGGACEAQLSLAERIHGRFPSVELLRFCNSGTEATMGAIRTARAFTGRSKILKMEGAYHGGHDHAQIAVSAPYTGALEFGLTPGVQGEVVVGRYNDLPATMAQLLAHRHDLAAVIVEPFTCAGGAIAADQTFLEGLREATREHGIALIFDEVVSFRMALGGAQEAFGIRPDLTAFGKIIGGGLPVGAFGGRADMMACTDPTRPTNFTPTGTYNGNPLTMAAGIATLDALDASTIASLNALGDSLRMQLSAICDRAGLRATVTGQGSIMKLHVGVGQVRTPADFAAANQQVGRLMHWALLNAGIYTPSRQMYVLSTPMSQAEVDTFADRFAQAVGIIAPGLARAA
ncbi:MAG: aspartate aminotransferase family protein [Gemmatimonadales bacterium]